jgi:hypothetical protein
MRGAGREARRRGDAEMRGIAETRGIASVRGVCAACLCGVGHHAIGNVGNGFPQIKA